MGSRLVPTTAELVLAHWTGITARVAWTLLRLGVEPRSDVFHEARLDAVLRLSGQAVPLGLEDLAEAHTEAWVARIRGQAPPAWRADWQVPVTPDNVPIRDDDPDLLVLRRHYGDHRRLVDLVRAYGVTRDTLEAAQDRLRRAARSALGAPEAPAPRADQLLRRLASWAPGPCPAVAELRAARHRAHVQHCPRCDRIVRLVTRDVLPLDAFEAPTAFPRPVVDVAVLQLHPSSGVVQSSLQRAFAVAAPLGRDAIVVSAHDPEGLKRSITEIQRTLGLGPHHLRGLRRRGPGALSPRGVAGPLLDGVEHELNRVDWGDRSDAVTPRTRSIGAFAAGVAVVAAAALVAVGTRVALPPPIDPSAPKVVFEAAPNGLLATFDVPEDAWVSAFALRDGRLQVVQNAASAADKASWATGDGRYRVVTQNRGLLLAIHQGPLEDLSDTLAAAQASDTPLPTLAEGLDRQATVRWRSPDVR